MLQNFSNCMIIKLQKLQLLVQFNIKYNHMIINLLVQSNFHWYTGLKFKKVKKNQCMHSDWSISDGLLCQ